MNHKKFIVFCMEYYYPKGGVSDIHTSFDDLEEAKRYVAVKGEEEGAVWEIVDRDTWVVLYRDH